MARSWLKTLFPARTTQPVRRRPVRSMTVEVMEDRTTPATLNITGGALTFTDAGTEANNLTVSVVGGVYTFNDANTNITLGAGAVSAGWRGTGTKTVSGPAAAVSAVASPITISVAGGANTVNIRSVAAGDDATVNGGTGNTTVNVGSTAPVFSGNLTGILAPLTVNAGTATKLTVANVTAATSGSISIGAAAITGLGAQAINYTGTFTVLAVAGSNTAAAETYSIAAPPAAAMTLDTYAGTDTVNIASTVGTLAVNTGIGNDAVGVLAGGIGGTLTINAGAGANTLVVDDTADDTGTAAGAVGTASIAGIAGSGDNKLIGFSAPGGTLGLTLNLGTAADLVTFGATAAGVTITANGNDGADQFTVTAAVTGSLNGNNGDDSFTISAAGAAISGGVDGGAGSDTLTVSGAATLTALGGIDGFNGTAQAGFSNIDVLNGTTSLTGLDAASAYNLAATQTYVSTNTLTFSGFTDLQGGTAVDTFNVTADTTINILAGAGDDAVNVADAATLTGNVGGETGNDTVTLLGSLAGSFDGGTGVADTLSYAGRTGAVTVVLASSTTEGFTSADNPTGFTGAGAAKTFTNVDVLTGNGNGGSTLTGQNSDYFWTLDGTPTYQNTAVASTIVLNFNGFPNLVGGTGDDTFAITDGSGLISLDGGAGTDTLVAVSIDLATATSGTITDPVGGVTFSNFEIFDITDALGLTAGADKMTFDGTNWIITQLNGAPTAIVFGNLLTINGLAGDDTFTLQGDSAIATVINGGADADTLLLDSAPENVNFNFTGTFNGGAGVDTVNVSTLVYAVNATVTGFVPGAGLNAAVDLGLATPGAVTGVDALIGNGAGSLTYAGSDTATWTIAGGGTNSLLIDNGAFTGTATFSGYYTLVGGDGTDIFNISRQDLLPNGYEISGGAGANSLAVNNFGSPAADYFLAGDNDNGSLGATGWADVTFHGINTVDLTASDASGDTLDQSTWIGTGFTSTNVSDI